MVSADLGVLPLTLGLACRQHAGHPGRPPWNFRSMLTRNACPTCGGGRLSSLGSYATKEAGIQLALCEECGLAFVNPMFEDADKAALQPNVRQLHRSRSAELSDTRALRRSRQRAQRWEYAAHRWLQPASRVLEVGAGDGALVEWLLAHGHNPVALDPDAESCAYIHERFGVPVLASRVEEADLAAPGPFDAVFMLNLIEHLEDPAAVLRQLRAVLRPGGILAVETPNILRTKVGPRRMFSLPHNYYFSPVSLRRLLAREGYETVQCRVFALDMFHLVARVTEGVVADVRGEPVDPAAEVRRAIRRHRWAYYLRGQFLLRKVPGFRNWYLYGRHQDSGTGIERARP